MFNDADRCFLRSIAERIVNQQLAGNLAIDRLRNANDAGALEVIDICDHRAKAPQTFLDALYDLIRLPRSINDALIKRRHRSGHIIDHCRLLAAPNVKHARLSEQLGNKTGKQRESYAPFPLHIHQRLHTMR